MKDGAKVVTESKAAQMLNVTPSAIRYHVRKGTLQAVYCGITGNRVKGILVSSIERVRKAARA